MQRTQEEAVMHATVTRLSFQRDQGVEAVEAALRRVIDGLPATHSEAEADAASASMRPVVAAAVGPLVAGAPSRSEGRVVVRRGFANPDDH
jgi:hypothetical protein